MTDNVTVRWKINTEQVTRGEAKAVVDQVITQVEEQTDEDVVLREGEELEPASGSTLVVFLLGVGSSLTGQVIWEVLRNRDETEDIEINADVDADNDADVDVDVSVDK
jgi:hypothetical protein